MMKNEAGPAKENGKTEKKTLSLITEASAIAQIALSLARVERDETKSLLADATKRLPEAHALFIRSVEIARSPPEKSMAAQPKEFYSYEELCSGNGTVIPIGDLTWHPYAKEGDGFIENLRHYALSSLEAELDKVRESLINCLCSLGPEQPQMDEMLDPRLFEIPDILENINATESLIRRRDMDDLLCLVDQALSNGEKRTLDWANQKLKAWSLKVAESHANDWHLQSKGSGLSSLFVTKLAEHRKKRHQLKGHKPKKT